MYPVSGSVKTVHFRTILFNAILLNKRYLLIWYTICFLKDKEITLSNRNQKNNGYQSKQRHQRQWEECHQRYIYSDAPSDQVERD